ncbi:MAG TPA: serine/threonine-protein kinase [Candidatus Acidoferrum sp.]|nr:serine/threonine-protein kinase [Candidatus Acidoferrum sp.]
MENPEQWQKVKQIVGSVLEKLPEQRAAYLDEVCGSDHALRSEVESLVGAYESSHGLSEPSKEMEVARAGQELKSVGPYRLLKKLGEGGMGQVWLAEQVSPVRREVALKLIKAGMYDDSVLRRFQSERQSLAIMDHPAIAKVFDAGTTPEGQPYFVMEYVPGVPITDYCDEKKLKIRARLELFIQACEGVQHAHQKAVIHRDLKPENILVVEVDGKPMPRIIDFGLAKAITPQIVGETLVTQVGTFVGTPGYLSPEQADPNMQDIDTRTDVYSLGVVLYVLLTGSLPFETAHWRNQPLDEALRKLRENDPPRPSTKASTESDSTKTRAEARGTEPKQLASLLRGDLDWITLKALERDRCRRYATPTELAADIRRYLRSEPVQAHPASVWYRGRKFVRHYWVPVTASAIVIASLSTGLYVANRQRLIAERRFGQLRQLSHDVLFDLDPELRALPGALSARNKLVSTSTRYLAGLSADAIHDKQLALEVAEAYTQVASIQGVPAWNNLGQYTEAEDSLRKAETLLDSTLAADPGNRQALWLSAHGAHDLAIVAYTAGSPDEIFIASASKAHERFNQLAGLGNFTRREINDATYIYADLAEGDIDLHRFEDAARYARLGVEISASNSTVSGPRAQVFSELAGALMDLGDVQGALNAVQQARQEWQNLRRDQGDMQYARMVLAVVREREGQILGEDGAVNLNQPMEAVARFRECFDPLEDSARKEPKDYLVRLYLAQVGHYLGDLLRHGNPKQALDVYDQSLLRIREVPNDVAARRVEALLLAGSSYPARWIHREQDARGRIDAAFRLLRESKNYPADTIKPGSEADTAMRALADNFAETGQPDKAIEVYQQLRSKILASNPDSQNDLLNAAYVSRLDASLAALLHRVGRTDEAVTLEGTRVELWHNWNRKLPSNPFVQRQLAVKSAF